jgi:hypothetical protein
MLGNPKPSVAYQNDLFMLYSLSMSYNKLVEIDEMSSTAQAHPNQGQLSKPGHSKIAMHN